MPDGNNILDALLDRELSRELKISPQFADEIERKIEIEKAKAEKILKAKWGT